SIKGIAMFGKITAANMQFNQGPKLIAAGGLIRYGEAECRARFDERQLIGLALNDCLGAEVHFDLASGDKNAPMAVRVRPAILGRPVERNGSGRRPKRRHTAVEA